VTRLRERLFELANLGAVQRTNAVN